MNRYHRTELKVWLTGKAGSESLGLDGLMSAWLRTRLSIPRSRVVTKPKDHERC